MAEIVNLRLVRKRKARADKEARAAQNRVAFGRTKIERDVSKAENNLTERRLDLHRRDEETE
ncbi:DUF4169 family protein [Microvirga brassicacearum]|uniref:DUF4169 family protein n=1 Tax=Microvirga brassicacearum TaxID=2580413 RepID=A0A5N3PBD0_9HYPH|nr:DUF4169 family protein [Microvirga brassicacearum]KAB0267004.1 DUF4169 family protein [Microvirga brassicacearum]